MLIRAERRAHRTPLYLVPFALGYAVGRHDCVREATPRTFSRIVIMPASHAAAATATKRTTGDAAKPELAYVPRVGVSVPYVSSGAALGIERGFKIKSWQRLQIVH